MKPPVGLEEQPYPQPGSNLLQLLSNDLISPCEKFIIEFKQKYTFCTLDHTFISPPGSHPRSADNLKKRLEISQKFIL